MTAIQVREWLESRMIHANDTTSYGRLAIASLAEAWAVINQEVRAERDLGSRPKE